MTTAREGQFAIDIAKFVEKTKQKADKVVRGVSLSLLKDVVLRSPVGNPDLWESNKGAVEYNVEVSLANEALRSDPANLTRNGRLKRGKKINDGIDVKAPPGYVGGRFRGNWQVSFDVPSVAELSRIDASGAQTLAIGSQTLGRYQTGQAVFIVNNLPYAIPLEYGHSTQAPQGMVRLAVAEFQRTVSEEVQKVQA